MMNPGGNQSILVIAEIGQPPQRATHGESVGGAPGSPFAKGNPNDGCANKLEGRAWRGSISLGVVEPGGRMTRMNHVRMALVAASLLLAGCTSPSPSSSKNPIDGGPSPGQNETLPTVWYIHHVGGCGDDGQGILNASKAPAEYASCTVPEQRDESRPVESFVVQEPWPALKAGALIQGRFEWEYSTFAAEAEIDYVLTWNGTTFASQHYVTNPIVTVVGQNLDRLQVTDFLDIRVTSDLPPNAMPTLDFFVRGTKVYAIYYDQEPYLCLVHADDPDLEAHRMNGFRDCQPEIH